MENGLSWVRRRMSQPKTSKKADPTVECTPQDRPQPFNSLPVDLLLTIVEYLSFTDALCLALTCKSLQNILDRDEELRGMPFFHLGTLPTRVKYHLMLPTGVKFMEGYKEFKEGYKKESSVFWRPRWRLLRQLEDSRWRCCSACLRLHPVGEFSRTQLSQIAEFRTCVFGLKVGAVRLCGHLQFTYRDRLKLMKTLMTEDATTPADISVQASMNARIENEHLIMEAHYHVRGEAIPTFDSFPYLLCPHRGLTTHVHDMFCTDVLGDRILQESWRVGPGMVVCEKCSTEITDVFHRFDTYSDWIQKTSFECLIHVKRYLGKGVGAVPTEWHWNSHTTLDNLSPHEHRKLHPGRLLSQSLPLP